VSISTSLSDKKKNIFSLVPLATKTPPVIIIGLPRSGSSLLAEVASNLTDWYVFDDLYFYRKAKSLNATSERLNDSQLIELVSFLGGQVRARLKYGFYCIPNIALADVDKFNEALIETFKDNLPFWHELLAEFMTRLALSQGCSNWGFKAPQDFMNAQYYAKIFPKVKFIFLYRDPRKVLSSFKFVDKGNGDSRLYHPVFYSLYWRMAIQELSKLQKTVPNQVLSVRYEDLVRNSDEQINFISLFLNTTIGEVNKKIKNNSSFMNKEIKTITPTETWLCEKIVGRYIKYCNYPENMGCFRFQDIKDLSLTTVIFIINQIKRFVFSPTARQSILMYIKNIFP